ncbi:MAG: hypothetical protein JSV80_05785 [Acidobacteriota bacterium]|nr:MAG: hypothetical protein JSV80_05785 [Acidobacteriota bacterium]
MRQAMVSLIVLILLANRFAATEVPPIELLVERGPGPGDVWLRWTGGDPTFEVFRSADPANVEKPANEIGETLGRTFVDTPPPGDLSCYRIGSRMPTVPEAVTIELLRPNDDAIGRPLPVAAHWNTGRPSASQPGWDPDFVMDYLEAGEYVIPGVYLRRPTVEREPASYYETLSRARALGVPFSVVFTQWDRPFSDDPRYAGLPPADNPNVIDAADGTTIIYKTDPEGPLERWQEVGAEWAQLPAVDDMIAAYPDPPLVLWVNNFEHPRLLWGEAETSWRFVENHGTATSDEDKRRFVGEGWIERDAALFQSLKNELPVAWQQVSIPICYTAFGRGKYGSWSGWDSKSLHVPGRFSPWPLAVNGSPSYYVFEDPNVHKETDYQANSPQAVGSNWQFMLSEAFRDNEDYFWEYSIYDGGTARHNWYRYIKVQLYDEARYKGYVRYGLWMSRPRIIREFRKSNQDREPYVSYWEALLEAVREVHEDPDLERFWRHGRLIVNDAHPHHWQKNLVPGYTDDDVDRNFILDADINPPRPWANDTEIAVWALALVLGETPHREWLLFAYSPLRDRDSVMVSIPGYGDVLVNVPRGSGRFWWFTE